MLAVADLLEAGQQAAQAKFDKASKWKKSEMQTTRTQSHVTEPHVSHFSTSCTAGAHGQEEFLEKICRPRANLANAKSTVISSQAKLDDVISALPAWLAEKFHAGIAF